MLARMKLRERLFADLDTRPRWRWSRLQLHDVGQFRNKFRREWRRGGIDDRLPRMIGMYGIGDDALPRMKRVGALWRKRLRRIGMRGRLRFRCANLESREVLDGAGPGKLRVVEGRVVAKGCGQQRERRHEKDNVPQRGGKYGALRYASFYPTIAEVVAGEKFSRCERPGEENADAARKALMEVAPRNVELGLDFGRDGLRRRYRSHPRGGSCA